MWVGATRLRGALHLPCLDGGTALPRLHGPGAWGRCPQPVQPKNGRGHCPRDGPASWALPHQPRGGGRSCSGQGGGLTRTRAHRSPHIPASVQRQGGGLACPSTVFVTADLGNICHIQVTLPLASPRDASDLCSCAYTTGRCSAGQRVRTEDRPAPPGTSVRSGGGRSGTGRRTWSTFRAVRVGAEALQESPGTLQLARGWGSGRHQDLSTRTGAFGAGTSWSQPSPQFPWTGEVASGADPHPQLPWGTLHWVMESWHMSTAPRAPRTGQKRATGWGGGQHKGCLVRLGSCTHASRAGCAPAASLPKDIWG